MCIKKLKNLQNLAMLKLKNRNFTNIKGRSTSINNIDINKIVVSSKVSFSKKRF